MSAGIPAGAMRFNSDSQKLEYWNGSAWFQVHTATPNLATAGDPTPGARGVFQGGLAPSDVDTVDYINISSTGNAIDFGDLSSARRLGAGFASSTRVFAYGGYDGSSNKDEIEYFTIASTGSRVDFGTNSPNANSCLLYTSPSPRDS